MTGFPELLTSKDRVAMLAIACLESCLEIGIRVRCMNRACAAVAAKVSDYFAFVNSPILPADRSVETGSMTNSIAEPLLIVVFGGLLSDRIAYFTCLDRLIKQSCY